MSTRVSGVFTYNSTHGDLVSENLGRGPVNESLVLIHAINHEGSSAADVVNRIVRELLNAGSLNLYMHDT